MIIEEAIQSSFYNDKQKATINILYTGAWLNQLHATCFKKFDLTGAQYNVLRILNGQHPNAISVADIISRMIDKASNASRIIDKLEKKQLVIRTTNAKDRRQVDVTITNKGMEKLKHIEPSLQDLNKSLNGLNTEELTQLNNLLNKFRNQ